MAQSIYSYQSIHDWESVIHNVFDDNISLLKLEKSYRTTYEIMESVNLISKWFGFSDAKAVLRHGKPVEIDQIDANHVASYLKNKIDYFLSVGFQSVAIICKDESSVNELSKKLNQNNIMQS